MNVTASLETAVEPEVLHAVVSDLGTYPSWLEIVDAAVPVPDPGRPDPEGTEPELSDHGMGPAWSVDLRARLGPFRRSKRLRMVRTVDSVTEVVFERRELDGREHSPWVLSARIEPGPTGATLTMSLHYGGSLWVPMLDRLLAEEIERSRHRLIELLAQRT